MKKRGSCELCNSAATTYCESDQASLCWHCDSKVHKANFLVSKHNRSLLCHLCQNPTPWTASGPMLPPSLSLCVSCASNTSPHSSSSAHHHHQGGDGELVAAAGDDDDDDASYSYDDVDGDGDSSYDVSDDDEMEEDDDDDDDNQVVPLTTNSGTCSTEADDDDEDEDDDGDGRMSSLLPPSLNRKREFHLIS